MGGMEGSGGFRGVSKVSTETPFVCLCIMNFIKNRNEYYREVR